MKKSIITLVTAMVAISCFAQSKNIHGSSTKSPTTTRHVRKSCGREAFPTTA